MKSRLNLDFRGPEAPFKSPPNTRIKRVKRGNASEGRIIQQSNCAERADYGFFGLPR
jgi:hypothetical protein